MTSKESIEKQKSNFTKKILKNGITVLHESRDLPIIALGIANRFGSEHEPSDLKGIAHFMEHLLFTGTKNRSAKQISSEIEKKGGILNAFTHNEITCFWTKMPSQNLPTGLSVLADILNNPLFDPKKFEKEKSVILEEIKLYKDDPKSYVSTVLAPSALYKPPFGEDYIIGNEATISALTPEFVSQFFKENYNPKNFIVALVGSCDLDYVCKFLEDNFEPRPSDKALEPLKIEKQNKDITEKRKNIDQAQVIFAAHAPLSGTKLYTALQLLNIHLTSGLSSVLFEEIREKLGLAYTIHGSIEAEKNYSTYEIYLGTLPSAVEKVKSIIIQSLENISELKESELKEAKEQLIGLKKISYEESTRVLESLIYKELQGDAEDFYKFEEKINLVTLEDIKTVASQIKEKHSFITLLPE